ncbi:MAG: hypothetical protein P4L71_19950 [Acetobacteraceae bacterium]|nr:hypothetical protein [Acetobacteraceae bacterium]
MAKGLLLAAFDFATARADEFHDWYDLEHVPERLRVPGFLNAERWIGDEDPTLAIATYDLTSAAVMNTPAYQAVAGQNVSVWTRRIADKTNRLMRFEGEQLVPGDRIAPEGAGGLLVASMNVDPAAEADFTAWYDTEHLPQLAAVPGVLCARRYRATAPSERRYAALYHLAEPAVARSDAWRRAADTPWSATVRPHFRDLSVWRCRRYQRAA